MSDEHTPNWISRMDAARRQIETAVRLHFEKADAVSFHTLVCTAHRLISKLGQSTTPVELVEAAEPAAEFLGSKGDKGTGHLNIEPLPELTQDLLFYSVLNLQAAAGDIPFQAKIYWAWFMHTHSERFTNVGPEASAIMANTEQLRSMSFYDIRQMLRLDHVLNLSEPLPEWVSISPERPAADAISGPTQVEIDDSPAAPRPSDSELDSEYDKCRRDFRNAVADCQAVSQLAGGRKTDERRWWASLLFTRLCVTAMSLLKILPESPLERLSLEHRYNPLESHWDFTAVAVLARTLFENHLTLFYLGLEDVDEDEWFSRLNLMQLHDHFSRKATFGPSSEGAAPADEGAVVADLEQKLRAKRFFQSLRKRTSLSGAGGLPTSILFRCPTTGCWSTTGVLGLRIARTSEIWRLHWRQ
jgi:hypothetical protein